MPFLNTVRQKQNVLSKLDWPFRRNSYTRTKYFLENVASSEKNWNKDFYNIPYVSTYNSTSSSGSRIFNIKKENRK